MAGKKNGLTRRGFLQVTGAAAAAAGLAGCTMTPSSGGGAGGGGAGNGKVSFFSDPKDPVASSASAKWALAHLSEVLAARGVQVRTVQGLTQEVGETCVVACGVDSVVAKELTRVVRVDGSTGKGAEGLILWPLFNLSQGRATIAVGEDARGLVYALLELADRVKHAPDPVEGLQLAKAVFERPANGIRSIIRLFANDIEDKPWFYDRDFWQRYLTMLATHRFNRFNLSLGLSYDFSTNLRDVYFFFAYPFLVNVPGFDVKAVGRDGKAVAAEEQQKNLEMIKYISDQAALRGLDFNLGIWTHSYRWTNSPQASHVIQGVTAENQGPYSRDAMHKLLEACPGITGITLRTHGESGVPEGNFDIWKVIMSGTMGHKKADGSVRKIEIDLHGKGMTQQMIDVAQGTGNPVTVSPKFWAEHMGLPYMQASIREAEMPKGRDAGGLMSLSSGTRAHMRYSYGDLLEHGRTYKVITRVWPGTQRLLLWGDPAYAAAYGKAFSFCGMDGAEYFDPLGFKGRAGSGQQSGAKGVGRSGYVDASLLPSSGPGGGDWEKYVYQYRLMGRLMYNPEAEAETWRRQLKAEFGEGAGSVETALGCASRILPMITTAHDAAAANAQYWPEVYVNQSIYDATRSPYNEMPNPHIFSSVSPLDPQMFADINQCAEALLSGKELARVTPLDVAWQLEKWADGTKYSLAGAEKLVKDKNDPAFRRLAIDAAIAAGIGRFFAHKFRAAVQFAIFDRTASEEARKQAVEAYGKAREAWAEVVKSAEGVYMADLSFGWDRNLRRNWADRMADIDRDIEGIKTVAAGRVEGISRMPEKVAEAVKRMGLRMAKQEVQEKPGAPATFKPGEPIEIRALFVAAQRAKLWYRHVHQGERYQSVEMAGGKGVIPAQYTKTKMPIQYYFEVEEQNGLVRMSPGFGQEFLGVPYFVMMPA